MGRAKGSFPHSNGASFADVGFFFPSVDPKYTMAAAIPAARTRLTAIPTYSLTTDDPAASIHHRRRHGDAESYLMQDEPGPRVRFSYKMSLEERFGMLGIDRQRASR